MRVTELAPSRGGCYVRPLIILQSMSIIIPSGECQSNAAWTPCSVDSLSSTVSDFRLVFPPQFGRPRSNQSPAELRPVVHLRYWASVPARSDLIDPRPNVRPAGHHLQSGVDQGWRTSRLDVTSFTSGRDRPNTLWRRTARLAVTRQTSRTLSL